MWSGGRRPRTTGLTEPPGNIRGSLAANLGSVQTHQTGPAACRRRTSVMNAGSSVATSTGQPELPPEPLRLLAVEAGGQEEIDAAHRERRARSRQVVRVDGDRVETVVAMGLLAQRVELVVVALHAADADRRRRRGTHEPGEPGRRAGCLEPVRAGTAPPSRPRCPVAAPLRAAGNARRRPSADVCERALPRPADDTRP